jgi:hypothetical protein
LGEDENENVELLRNFLKNHKSESQPNQTYCKRYLASSQIKAFIKVFNSIN